jgi:preprotein translocase subunit SecB
MAKNDINTKEPTMNPNSPTPHTDLIEKLKDLAPYTDPVFLKVVYVGVFTVNDEPNMDLEEFGKVNAPAILFPYVREEIHNRTMKGSLPRRFILQPLNSKAALNSDD